MPESRILEKQDCSLAPSLLPFLMLVSDLIRNIDLHSLAAFAFCY